jgi:hypothetical protein
LCSGVFQLVAKSGLASSSKSKTEWV